METETEPVEVVIKDSKVNNFKNDLAKEVIGTLCVVAIIAVAKVVGKKLNDKFQKRHSNVIETTATEK